MVSHGGNKQLFDEVNFKAADKMDSIARYDVMKQWRLLCDMKA